MSLIKKNKTSIIKWSILVFALFPLIPNSIKGLPVIFLLVISLIYFSFGTKHIKLFIGYSFLFIIYIYSLIYTSNIDFAYKKIETSLSIIIFPFIFFVLSPKIKLNKDIQLSFAKIYVKSTTIFSFISFIIIILDTNTTYYKNFYSNKFRIVVENLPLIGQHPIYASLFLALAILFNLNLFYKEKKTSLLYPLLINTVLLLMLSSKGIIVSLIIISLLFLFFVIKIKRIKKIYFLIFIIISIVTIFSFNRRMQELIQPKTYLGVNSNYSNSYRLAITNCSIDLIKESWFFGYGVGDAQDKLNECYTSKSNVLLKKTYNSHNQYIDAWLKTGIIGFLYLISFLTYLIVLSLKKKNYLFFAILLLYTINFLFENILNRQSGVILFYYLICFFSIDAFTIKKNNSSV